MKTIAVAGIVIVVVSSAFFFFPLARPLGESRATRPSVSKIGSSETPMVVQEFEDFSVEFRQPTRSR